MLRLDGNVRCECGRAARHVVRVRHLRLTKGGLNWRYFSQAMPLCDECWALYRQQEAEWRHVCGAGRIAGDAVPLAR